MKNADPVSTKHGIDTSLKHYLVSNIIKTLGTHFLLLRLSYRYRIQFFAGKHAIAINHGANLSKEVTALDAHLCCGTQRAAVAIIFHPQFGEITRNRNETSR